jgi:hypothetical protein
VTPTAPSQADLQAKGAALGKFFKDKLKTAPPMEVTGTPVDGGVEFKDVGVIVSTKPGDKFVQSSDFRFYPKVTTLDGSPVATPSMGPMAPAYGRVLVLPSGDLIFGDNDLTKLSTPVAPPDDARITGVLTPDQAEQVEQSANTVEYGTPEF